LTAIFGRLLGLDAHSNKRNRGYYINLCINPVVPVKDKCDWIIPLELTVG